MNFQVKIRSKCGHGVKKSKNIADVVSGRSPKALGRVQRGFAQIWELAYVYEHGQGTECREVYTGEAGGVEFEPSTRLCQIHIMT